MASSVVLADLPALAEIVEDGETGCLYPAGDAQALADTVEELLNDAGKRENLGKSAKKWISKERTWNKLVSKIQLYE